MLTASYQKHLLKFKLPGGTSRGMLKTKETFFIYLEECTKSRSLENIN